MKKNTKTIILIAAAVVLSLVIFLLVRRIVKRAGNREKIRDNAQTIAQLEQAGGRTAELTDSQQATIATEVYEALDGWGTDEQKLLRAIKSIPTAADYLAVKNAYTKEYERDMYEDILDDLEPLGSFTDVTFGVGGEDDDRVVFGRIDAHLNSIAVPENLR